MLRMILVKKEFLAKTKLKQSRSFQEYAKVFISSEKELPKGIEKYQSNIAPERMHDALAFSSLVFGESSTMAEEAAMLGYLQFISTTKHLLHEHLKRLWISL